MRRRRGLVIAILSLPLFGCAGNQSALDVHGEGARQILRLIGIFTGLSVVVWVAVMAVLAMGLLRRRSEGAPEPLAERNDGGAVRIVTGAAILTAAIIIALTALSYFTDKSLASRADNPLTIRITGHQWWWEVRYEDPQPSRTLQTANEIHIPVGQDVRVKLESTDVIHSFWVPSLAGKEDLIPGRQNELTLHAERAGVYRGQCAEFCGLQHAHMAFLVVADPPDEFGAWWDRQLGSAAEPGSEEAQRGKQDFLSGSCVLCHTIRGTPAGGKVGPDLTHIGSRQTIAAGTLPMNRQALGQWIADPQRFKPGSNMPVSDITAGKVSDIAAYLEGLK